LNDNRFDIWTFQENDFGLFRKADGKKYADLCSIILKGGNYVKNDF